MLPEFPKSRQAMLDLWSRALFRGRNGFDPLLSDIPVRIQREGKTAIVGNSEMKYKRYSVEISIERRRARGMQLDEFVQQAVDLGREMATQQVRGLIDEIAKPTPHSASFSWEPGNLHMEIILEAWSKMQIDFGADGLPRWPTAWMPPAALDELQGKMQEWLEDPSLRKKWEDLVEKKREDYNEREARRRLVD